MQSQSVKLIILDPKNNSYVPTQLLSIMLNTMELILQTFLVLQNFSIQRYILLLDSSSDMAKIFSTIK